MKFYIISIILCAYSLVGVCQQSIIQYECGCDKIGLDLNWADTNQISCYQIPVERNFTKPRGQQYLLAVAIASSINLSPKEPILYLHGGPGIATLSNLPRYLKNKTFSQLRENHSLVFFDYRGTGFSEPSFCKTLGDLVSSIMNAGLSNEELIRNITVAYSMCREEAWKDSILVNDFSTLQSAADAETIRQTFGLPDWNIYSVSHGTTVALNMMRTFPNHIRSVILDSPFPPNAPWIDFIHPFDTAFTVLEKSLKQDSIYGKLFSAIRNDFVKISRRLHHTPFVMPVDQRNDSITNQDVFDDGEFAWSVWTAMLDPGYLRLVPLTLKEIAQGNDSVLLHWALLFNDPNSFGEYSLAQSNAILYYESKPRFEEETEKYLLQHYPDFAGFITPGIEPSLHVAFQPESPPREYFDPVHSSIPTLIFSGEHDPVCPPLFSTITARTLSHSTVIIVPAASHAAIHKSDCTRAIGKTFYLNPEQKPETDCVMKIKKIEFITSEILDHLK